jgi:hypothetical protein
MLSDIKVNKSVFHGKNGFSIAKYEAIILGLVYNPEPPTEKTVRKI